MTVYFNVELDVMLQVFQQQKIFACPRSIMKQIMTNA